jgi:hypothetical protein
MKSPTTVERGPAEFWKPLFAPSKEIQDFAQLFTELTERDRKITLLTEKFTRGAQAELEKATSRAADTLEEADILEALRLDRMRGDVTRPYIGFWNLKTRLCAALEIRKADPAVNDKVQKAVAAAVKIVEAELAEEEAAEASRLKTKGAHHVTPSSGLAASYRAKLKNLKGLQTSNNNLAAIAYELCIKP